MNAEEIDDIIDRIQRRCSETTNGVICEDCSELPEFILCSLYRESQEKIKELDTSYTSLYNVSVEHHQNFLLAEARISELQEILKKKDELLIELSCTSPYYMYLHFSKIHETIALKPRGEK